MNKYELNARPLAELIAVTVTIANTEFDGRFSIFKTGKDYRVGFGYFKNDFLNVDPEPTLKQALIEAILEKRSW